MECSEGQVPLPQWSSAVPTKYCRKKILFATAKLVAEVPMTGWFGLGEQHIQ
jgi:hypothetical protein